MLFILLGFTLFVTTSILSLKKEWLTILTMKTLYVYSYLQIYVSKKYESLKTHPQWKPYFETYQTLLDKLNKVNRVIRVKLKPDTINTSSTHPYDFLIFQHKRDTKINHIIHFMPKKNIAEYEGEEEPLVLDPEYMNYTYCTYKFILLTVLFDDGKEKYDLVLNQPYNYYIVNNVINTKVVRYLLQTQYNVYKPKDVAYVFEFFDHNMKIQMIDQDQEIVFERTDYKIRTYDTC